MKHHTTFLAVGLLLCFVPVIHAQDPVRVLVITRSGLALPQAFDAFQKQYGKGLLELEISGDEVPKARIENARVIFFYYSPNALAMQIRAEIRAARMAAAAGDNAISRHDREVSESLGKSGVDAVTAGKIGRARVFGNKPGQYGVGLDKMVEQSKDAGSTKGLADIYLHYMSFAFSGEIRGETAPPSPGGALSGERGGSLQPLH